MRTSTTFGGGAEASSAGSPAEGASRRAAAGGAPAPAGRGPEERRVAALRARHPAAPARGRMWTCTVMQDKVSQFEKSSRTPQPLRLAGTDRHQTPVAPVGPNRSIVGCPSILPQINGMPQKIRGRRIVAETAQV